MKKMKKWLYESKMKLAGYTLHSRQVSGPSDFELDGMPMGMRHGNSSAQKYEKFWEHPVKGEESYIY